MKVSEQDTVRPKRKDFRSQGTVEKGETDRAFIPREVEGCVTYSGSDPVERREWGDAERDRTAHRSRALFGKY